jgi:predicted PurR-regulated permease PerM
LEFFGFVGLILGPVVLAVSLALIRIYKDDYGRNHRAVEATEPVAVPEETPTDKAE